MCYTVAVNVYKEEVRDHAKPDPCAEAPGSAAAKV